MLADELKTVLGTSFAFFVKASHFHWNVEGSDFYQLHEFFGALYQEVYSSIDTTAEAIRQLDEYAPGSLARFQELSEIQDQTRIPRAALMLEELLSDNEILLEVLNRAFTAANEENQQGIADYIAGRIDAHAKHAWMLRSFLKNSRA